MSTTERALRIGVLASQGGFEAHVSMLAGLGAQPLEVRVPTDLEAIDGLVLPGGESTTIAKAMARDGLDRAIAERGRAGIPILGTCAGMIVLDRDHLGLLDMLTERNAFGRQRQSFEQDLVVDGIGGEPLRAVFIRAPWVAEHGEAVRVLADYQGHPVVVRQGAILASAFHPELGDDPRLHALFMAIASEARKKGASHAFHQ